MSEATMLCPRCWGSNIEPGRDDRSCTYCQGDGIAPNPSLSAHFWLDEFVESQNALRYSIPNDPSDAIVEEMRRLCQDILEPLRSKFGPIRVDSGYRSPALNKKIGGVESSVHRYGAAADILPMRIGVKRRDFVDWLKAQKFIKFDQLIFEGTWVHVGRISPDGNYRRQVLMMFKDSRGRAVYSPYDPNDKRVAL